MRKRALITGASGSIGVHLVAHLLEYTDWDVIILDSFHHKGYKDRIREICKEKPDWVRRITEFQQDLVCPISPELEARIGSIDYILHLAALSDVFFSVENPVWVVQNNVNSTLTILEYARKIKPEAFVYFSTDETMGPVLPGQAHKEWETHRPSNAYAASKAASEDICYAWWRSYGIPLILTNTMNNFSQMQSGSKFPAMVQRMLENGETVPIHGNEKEIGTRFYIHSTNTADALLYILNNLPPHLHEQGKLDEPDRYHIVGEKAISNLELAQIIARLMDRKLDYRLEDFHKDNPAHDIHYGLQDNKLSRAGWKPPLSLEESLEQTIKWQQNHKEWM